MAKNGQKWPKMAKNGQKWPKLGLLLRFFKKRNILAMFRVIVRKTSKKFDMRNRPKMAQISS